jgi:hypothetical protein
MENMDAEQIISIIKKRQADFWDSMQIGDATYDITVPSAIVAEYDALLIEIGAIKREQAKSA